MINLDDAIEIVKGGGDMREGEKMELPIGLQLSDTMLDTIDKMSKYGKLVRYDGGFWSWENTELEPLYNGGIFQCMVPSWHCDVKTLRALSKRNIVILDEEHKWCRLKGEKHNAD